MSLENLNLQEMSHQEMNETDGGIIPLLIGLVVILVTTNSCGGAVPGCGAAKPLYRKP
jgi:lactobin A/cerein 7B family class IIb bacteriocin